MKIFGFKIRFVARRHFNFDAVSLHDINLVIFDSEFDDVFEFEAVDVDAQTAFGEFGVGVDT